MTAAFGFSTNPGLEFRSSRSNVFKRQARHPKCACLCLDIYIYVLSFIQAVPYFFFFLKGFLKERFCDNRPAIKTQAHKREKQRGQLSSKAN